MVRLTRPIRANDSTELTIPRQLLEESGLTRT